MQDFFYFSKVTKGVHLLNDLKLSFSQDQFMCLMFKIHLDQICEELDEENQHR